MSINDYLGFGFLILGVIFGGIMAFLILFSYFTGHDFVIGKTDGILVLFMISMICFLLMFIVSIIEGLGVILEKVK